MVGFQLSSALKSRLRSARDLVLGRFLGHRFAGTAKALSAKYPPVENLEKSKISVDVGHIFDPKLLELEAAAQAHQPVGDWGPEYNVIKASFDPIFYLAHNADIRDQALDPVGHYLRAGARENRDPTPWFSTAEYRRKYMTNARGRVNNGLNPFYHYLTEGRAAGNAPRAPANYGEFCNSIGLSPVEASDLVTRRIEDVRDRLRHGELGEMVMKANTLDPLVGKSWRAGLKVRVPPSSNAIGVRRIGHLLDLQHQVKTRRARAVVVLESNDLASDDPVRRQILDRVISEMTAQETVVIVTGGLNSTVRLDADVRVAYFGLAMPRAKDYAPCRTLVEFIRSMRPQTVINLDAKLMKTAMRAQGRAVAASSTVYQYLPFDAAQENAWSDFGARYYRAIDTKHQVIVPTSATRDHLAKVFALPEADRTAIWVAEDEDNRPPLVRRDLSEAANA